MNAGTFVDFFPTCIPAYTADRDRAAQPEPQTTRVVNDERWRNESEMAKGKIWSETRFPVCPAARQVRIIN